MQSSPGPQKGSDQESQWVPCSTGLLRQAALDSLLSRRRTLLKLIAGGTGLAAIGGGTAIGLMLSDTKSGSKKPGANPLGGLACISVFDQMPKYLDGALEEQLTEQITAHLMDCLKCRQMYKKMCCNSDPDCVSRPRKPKFRSSSCSQ